jgi:hypothetical protein
MTPIDATWDQGKHSLAYGEVVPGGLHRRFASPSATRLAYAFMSPRVCDHFQNPKSIYNATYSISPLIDQALFIQV